MLILLRQAATARELRAIDHRILCAASDVLDFVTYRPLKLVMVAQLLGVSEATASTALRRLAAAGFLDRRPSADRRTPEYRLPASRILAGTLQVVDAAPCPQEHA